MSTERQSLTIHEAAAYLSVHPQTVRRLARKGKLPSFKVGQSWRFSKAALQQWVDTHHLRTRPPRVLIVDDEVSIRKSTCAILENANYSVTTAADGPEALERIADTPPNVVLLDLQLPKMDGAETLARIRETDANISVIIMTGYPESELMSRALAHGPFLVMAKPVSKSQLLEGVLTALNAQRGAKDET